MWSGNSGYPGSSQSGAPSFPNAGNYVSSPGMPGYQQPQPPLYPSPQPQSPPAQRGFGGPPPVSRDNHPGHHHHNAHHQNSGYPGQYAHSYAAPPSAYAPPPGPPGYAPPQGPPGGSYAPPQGPPGGYAPPGPPGGYGAPNQRYASSGGPPPMPPSQQQFYGSQNQQAQQPYFQYSQCNGKKKALCIGINYFGQKGQLAGCINDANNVKAFLIRQYGYKAEDMVMLTDDSKNAVEIPTKQNIITAMQWLVRGASPNDSLFFHYSGHGGQTKDLDGDEDDGYDEVVYPVDYQVNGHIVDDLMHEIMVKPLPSGCRLTAIFDSCHSGSVLDLPYIYSTEGKIKEPNLLAEAGQGLFTAVTSYQSKDFGRMISSLGGLAKIATGDSQKADKITKATRTSSADVISWSGCKDSQTSADTQEAGKATGAMSYAFMTVLSTNPQLSYQQLLVGIRQILSSKYSQKPQLSSSHPIDTNIRFIA